MAAAPVRGRPAQAPSTPTAARVLPSAHSRCHESADSLARRARAAFAGGFVATRLEESVSSLAHPAARRLPHLAARRHGSFSPSLSRSRSPFYCHRSADPFCRDTTRGCCAWFSGAPPRVTFPSATCRLHAPPVARSRHTLAESARSHPAPPAAATAALPACCVGRGVGGGAPRAHDARGRPPKHL